MLTCSLSDSGDYGFDERPEQSDKVKQLFMQSQINRAGSLLRSGDNDAYSSASAVELACYSDMVARDHVEDYFLLQVSVLHLSTVVVLSSIAQGISESICFSTEIISAPQERADFKNPALKRG